MRFQTSPRYTFAWWGADMPTRTWLPRISTIFMTMLYCGTTSSCPFFRSNISMRAPSRKSMPHKVRAGSDPGDNRGTVKKLFSVPRARQELEQVLRHIKMFQHGLGISSWVAAYSGRPVRPDYLSAQAAAICCLARFCPRGVIISHCPMSPLLRSIGPAWTVFGPRMDSGV